jgi:hypothetical protein
MLTGDTYQCTEAVEIVSCVSLVLEVRDQHIEEFDSCVATLMAGVI